MTDGGYHEREFRYALRSRGGFERLLRLPLEGSAAPEEQSNHYFDSRDGALRKSGILLRLRCSTTCVVTLKCGQERCPGLYEAAEFEDTVGRAEVAAILRRPALLRRHAPTARRELERRLGAVDLTYLGCLRNERYRRRGPGGAALEIDRLQFPDGTERYELEVETLASPEAFREQVLVPLRALGVDAAAQRQTKSEQFVSWLAEQSEAP